jgi:hypothetical protein
VHPSLWPREEFHPDKLLPRFLAAIKDPVKRLEYLDALDSQSRTKGHLDWLRASAKWRLQQQLRDLPPE